MPGGAAVDAEFLVSLPVRSLAALLACGDVSSVAVLRAFRERARAADAKLNIVTEWLDAAADARAAELDAELASTGAPRGPLHGVPFTLKDHFHLSGTRMTMGDVALAGYRSKSDSLVARLLLDAGGVCFAKTNMSEHGETWASSNPLFGTTLNPWDKSRTAGGSSSGEGALVGVAGTAFGVGSDVGGSVRIPAAFNGHCALKPTAARGPGFSLGDKLLLNFAGEYGVPAAAGPMARRVDDIALVMEVLCGSTAATGGSGSPAGERGRQQERGGRVAGQHARSPPVPFDVAVYGSTRRLRFGFWLDEAADPPVNGAARRAVLETAAALRRHGHEVAPFAFPPGVDVDAVFGLYMQLQAAKATGSGSGGGGGGGGGGGEGAGEAAAAPRHHPEWLAGRQAAMTYLMGRAADDGGRAAGFPTASSPAEYFALVAKRDKLRDAFFAAVRRQGFDVLLSPTWPAPPTTVARVPEVILAGGEWAEGGAAGGGRGGPTGTFLQNLLDAACGVVPVSRYTAADVRAIAQQAADARASGAPISRLAELVAEDSVGAEGLPLTVSVTGGPWEEELVLNAMRHVEAACAWDVSALNVAQLAKL